MENNDLTKTYKSNDDEIDIEKLLKLLKKEKKIISILTTFTTGICVLFYMTIKPTWLGRFQIVVKEEENSIQKNNPFNPGEGAFLSQLSGAAQGKRTQELILKSPSVLMPVYDFNKEYINKNKLKVENRSFDKWFKKSFNIFFEKGSNVLTIEYKSIDKDLIQKTLNLVSDKYQNYAKINKEKYLANIIDYLIDQKNFLTKKSNQSMNNFNEFTIKNRLASVDGFVDLENDFNNQNTSIKMGKTNSIKDLKGRRFMSQFSKLDEYETKYIDLSSRFKPNSKIMLDLKLKIDNLRASLKRPNQILTQYRQLKIIALRDEQTLSSISSELDSYKLEKALQPLPWDLISKPTIKQNKIFPNISFLITLIIGGTFFINSLYLVSKKVFENNQFSKKS